MIKHIERCKFLEHGAPKKKFGHEKVTKPCIPPHGFFKEELGLSCINSSQKTSNCEEKNPCGGIHGLVTFAKCIQNDFCEEKLLKILYCFIEICEELGPSSINYEQFFYKNF